MLKRGEVLGNYQIDQPIGAGGMAVVYRAQHRMLGTSVAIKVLAPHLTLNEKVRYRFRQEAYLQANLVHPNVVRVTDLISVEHMLAIVMDYIDGPNLSEYLVERSRPLGLSRLIAIMGPVLEAIDFAHQRGVVHRDLKPSNIMLDRTHGGQVPKIVDFGIAKLLGASGRGMTKTGAVIGTPWYMPPEQLRGQTDIDQRADIYSVGAVIYELVTGQPPFMEMRRGRRASDYEITGRILSGAPPKPPSQIIVGLPHVFDDVVARAMTGDRRNRYPSASSLLTDLKSLTKGGQSRARRQPPEGPSSESKGYISIVVEESPRLSDRPRAPIERGRTQTKRAPPSGLAGHRSNARLLVTVGCMIGLIIGLLTSILLLLGPEDTDDFMVFRSGGPATSDSVRVGIGSGGSISSDSPVTVDQQIAASRIANRHATQVARESQQVTQRLSDPALAGVTASEARSTLAAPQPDSVEPSSTPARVSDPSRPRQNRSDGSRRNNDGPPDDAADQSTISTSSPQDHRNQSTPIPVADEPGFLSVQSVPAAEVFVDGQSIGWTAIVDQPLAPGRYRIRLVNVVFGLDYWESVQIIGGESQRIRHRGRRR